MENNIKAGFGRMNITPPLDISLEGSWGDIFPQGVDSELYVNALAMDDGTNEIILLSVDICWVPWKVFVDMRDAISDACGIPAESIIISATHTHTGPRLQEQNYDAYTGNLKQLAVTAARLAQKQKQTVRIGVGKDTNSKYVHNRRLKRPDGSITMNWIRGESIKDCMETGAVDPEVLAIRFEDDGGRTVGFIINYANHNNAFDENKISSDISGHISDILRKVYGENIGIIFLLGACGNVNWIDIKNPSWGSSGHYKKIATSLAGTILGIIAEMEYPKVERIKVDSRILVEKERPFNDYDTCTDMTFGGDPIFPHFLNVKKERSGKPLMDYCLDVHTLSLGEDIVLATSPAELFADYGLEIKSGSPFKYTFVAELTNGCVFYMPTPEAYKEGGYEVRKPATELHVEAGERLVKNTLEMLNSL